MNAKTVSLKKRYGTRVALPAALILFCTVVAVGLGLRYAGAGVDDMSSQGQTFEAYRALGRSMDELSLGQEAVTNCDDCARIAGAATPDATWLDANIGTLMYDLYHAHETIIFDANDKPVYASLDRKPASQAQIQSVMPLIKPFIERVRGRTHEKSNYSERLPNSPLAPFNAVKTSPNAIHSTDLEMINGRPAIVSVMRIVPRDRVLKGNPAQTPLIANIRFMDAGYLVDLGKQNFLLQPRIAASPKLQPGESFVALTTSRLKPLGFLIWKPFLPGSMLVTSLLPWGIGAIGVLTLLLAILAGCVWYLMRRDHQRVQQLEAAQLELKASEAQAHHLAYHDVLTGLPNRAHFTSQADQALGRVRHGTGRAAIMLLDLDRFKLVNDRFGHLAGDQLIEEVARRLTAIIGTKDCIARLGGDEFAILLDNEHQVETIELIVDRILADLRQPFEVLGNQAFIGVSIGIATAPSCGTERSDLMRKADIALYRAKDEGRDCYRHFTNIMDDTVQLRSTLEAELRHALESGDGLAVHYQPLMEASGRDIVGVEALVRWSHPVRGMIAPEIFVPIAEETGLISTLGDWVLQQACSVAVQWPGISVAVNLSPVQFRVEGFADHVENLVRAAGVDPRQIELEVTEGVLVDDDEIVRASLNSLRQKGFRIALDDFGTGYSSLSYLRNFEVDKIKIDKSFVKHLGETHDAAAIITAVVTLGHAMGLRVTAEGVETGDQSRFLADAGCNELQGFLYSRAVPAGDLPDLMAKAAAAKAAPPARRKNAA